MSKDIRSFFSVASKKSPHSNSPAIAKHTHAVKRKAQVIISDDEDDQVKDQNKSKKVARSPTRASTSSGINRRRIFDSDDEDNHDKPPIKQNGSSKPNLSKLKNKESTSSHLKPIDVSSIFSKDPVKRHERSPAKKSAEKSASKKDMKELFDDDFNLDDLDQAASPKKKTPIKQPSKNEETQPQKRRKITPEKNEKIAVSSPEVIPETPTNLNLSKSKSESDHQTDEERFEKKRIAAILYQKFKNRSGPPNPGSKSVPEGKPNCFNGLTFVLSGVYDSLERDEAAEIIKKYGGKVTAALSKKTNYLLAGEDAGPAKLAKADEWNITVLSEDGLLNLIKEKSGDTSRQNGDVKVKTESKEKTPAKKIESVKKEIQSPKKERKSPKKIVKSEDVKEYIIEKSIPQSMSTKKLETEDTNCQAWVDRYKPKSVKEIIGQQGAASNSVKLTNWLKNWYINHDGKKKLQRPNPWAKNDDGSYYKAALLSGPPGIGKTTTAALVCKELQFDTVEFNASDTRSKRLLKDEVSELLSNKSLYGYFHGGLNNVTIKHVLIMDEVDGMAGNEDRGGMAELIALIKDSHVPIICMCNDRNHPKIRSLVNYCYDLRFQRPRLEQIKGAMMSICFKEQIKLPKGSIDEIIASTNNDIRQTLNYLSLLSANKSIPGFAEKEKETVAKKDLKLGPWEVVRKVFSLEEHKNMTLNDKSDLFFYDYSIAPLFVQQNYLIVTPKCPKTEIKNRVALTADSLSLGDLVEKRIRSNNAWSLLPLQAMYSSVLPGEYMAGHVSGQINFPGWLGKNSKSNKRSRLAQEIHDHTRLRTSGSRLSIRLDYSQFLLDRIVKPLRDNGLDGVSDSLAVLKEYRLLREDIDSLVELTTWPGKKSQMDAIDGKVKAALTRTYNKEVMPYSYTALSAVKKKKSDVGGGDDMIEYGNVEDGGATVVESDEEEDTDNLANDLLIKAKKKEAPKPSTSKKISSKSSGSSGSSKSGRGGKQKGK